MSIPRTFTLMGIPCSPTTSATVQSPINLLLTDPQGRRIGFDSTTGLSVNEIGPPSFFSGPNTEPELIDVGATLPGTYSVEATGTQSGTYTLSLATIDED